MIGQQINTHGCLAPCQKCNQGCPICHPCDPLKHGGLARDSRPPYVDVRPRTAVKCDLCGSTAMDHTEMHCQLNRNLRPNQTLNTTKGDLDNE